MVECLVESSVECQVGSSANTHPTSNPLHKGLSDDLGWVLAAMTLSSFHTLRRVFHTTN